MTKVAILGAGINGLSCGVRIKEKYPNVHVTILSKEFSPETTGDGSGGLWCPYLSGKTPENLVSKWGGETYEFYHRLWIDGGSDVSLMPIYRLYKDACDITGQKWLKITFGFDIMNKKQLEYFSKLYSSQYLSGITFVTFVVNPPAVLRLMQKRFLNAGGKLKPLIVTTLDGAQLSEYDVIINCLGLGAREVVPDDKVYPLRGQICKVAAPWVNQVIMDDDAGKYIIPNVDFCVLGGTSQKDNYNRNISDDDTYSIINGCQKIIPGLEQSKVIQHWVGLRPAREQIRLEAEEKNGKVYIHNYGHGGCGLTLFWGCSSDVLKLFESVTSREAALCKL